LSGDINEFDERIAQGKEMMLTAPSVDIDVQQLREVVAAYLVEHFSEEERDDTAASPYSSRRAVETLLPDGREGEMQQYIREKLQGAIPNIYCVRAATEEYFCRRRNRLRTRILAQPA
jgi:hypothetical protein